MIKLVAFDWNGTLLADTWTVEHADNIILKKYGLPVITIRRFQETFKIPISDYWKALGFDMRFFKNHAKEINDLFCEHYEPLADKCRSRGGAKELLKWLKKNKIEAVIYSNHTTVDIIRQLKRLGLEKYIAAVLARPTGDHSHMHQKSKEAKLKDYILKYRLKGREVVSVGDTEEEVEIGQSLKCHTVAITGGYNTQKRLKAVKPDFLIHNLRDMKKIVSKLNHQNKFTTSQ